MPFYCVFLLALNSMQGQQSEAAEETAMETSIEKIGDYAQFAPTAFSLITVLAKGDKEGFWQLGKSATANLTATWILKYASNKPRPEGRLDGHAFPSGHTSFSF